MIAGKHPIIVCIDEAGRGALAGPVAVGVQLYIGVETELQPVPAGLRDSKLIPEKKREKIAPLVRAWGSGGVGYAHAHEIDEIGITRAQSLAAVRALKTLGFIGCLEKSDASRAEARQKRQAGITAEKPRISATLSPALSQTPRSSAGQPHWAVLLDGVHDWISAALPENIHVQTLKSADKLSTGVAAASVRAKTARDNTMRALAAQHPQYAWENNKGYGSKQHMEAINRFGPCALHRKTFLHG